jgi:hypothetical protein
MNILYYDARRVNLPSDPLDSSDSSDDDDPSRSHFISIGKDSRHRKGHMIDIYVSIVSDHTNKIIVHVNEL